MYTRGRGKPRYVYYRKWETKVCILEVGGNQGMYTRGRGKPRYVY